MSETEFWTSTPYLTGLAVEAAAERQKVEWRRAAYTAWHAGAFFRVKRMPRFQQMLNALEPRPTTRQSPDEILRTVVAMNAAFGGQDLRKKK